MSRYRILIPKLYTTVKRLSWIDHPKRDKASRDVSKGRTSIPHSIVFSSTHLHLFGPVQLSGRSIAMCSRDTGALNLSTFVTWSRRKCRAPLSVLLSFAVSSFVFLGLYGAVSRKSVYLCIRAAHSSFPGVHSISLSVLRKPPAASAQECMKSVTAPRRNLPFESSRT